MGFTFKVNVTADNTKELMKALRKLEAREILAGFPEDQNQPRKEGETNNASLAYINDQGSPAQRIPPRPFMQPGVEAASEGIAAGLSDAATAALDGNPLEMDRGFEMAGMQAVSGIKNTIVGGLQPPLSPVTLMMRRRRGIKSSKPLVATAQMLNALTYVVKTKP